ncbi:tubulin-like doman-containing protein [Azospirillum cavernae]|nr:tubulin-like doman-containing protein [Azospirillum cavernae]
MSDDDFIPEPTLLVGIGGSGCAIIDRLLGNAERSKRAPEHRIQVLGIDTDVEDLKHHRYLGPEHILRIGAMDDVYRMWERNRPGVENWFLHYDSMTPDIRRMSVGTGAGQIRILSTLAFSDAMNDRLIEDAIDRVVKGINQRSLAPLLVGPMNIIIVGSMAGGTGSGLFLALAWLLIRKFRSLGGVVPVVRGLLLMGDVFCHAARLPAAQMDNVRTNSYAALTELNAATLEAARKLPRPVDFRHLNRGTRIADDNSPFEEVILVDYNDRMGASLGPNLENYYSRCASILHFLTFTSVGSRYRSLFANEILSRSSGTACGRPKIYTGVGVSDLFYPRDDILHYLSLRTAKQAMQDDWLTIDRAFDEQKTLWLRRRKDGITEPEPVKARFFTDMVRVRGRDNGNHFFRAILHAVEVPPPPLDERGEQSAEIDRTYETFLSSFTRRAEQIFYESHHFLASWRNGPGVDSDNPLSSLAQWVNERERKLNLAEEKVFDALVGAPAQTFRDLFLTKIDRHESDFRPEDIEYYILRNGVHPMQVRFFLYGLSLALERELKRLGPSDELDRLIAEAAKMAKASLSSDPSKGALARSRRSYTAAIADRADDAARTTGLLKGRRVRRDFLAEYRRHYASSADIIKAMIDNGLRRGLYAELRMAVNAMVAELEEFFKVVDRLSNRIDRDIDELENRYDGERESAATVTGSIARADDQRAFWVGNVPVHASRTAMRSIWSDVEESQKTLQSQPILKGLARTLCQRFRDVTMGRDNKDGVDYERLFRDNVIDGYCRDTISRNATKHYDFDVITAIQREAKGRNQDWRLWLADRVRILREQSAPLIATESDRAGSRVVMWAMNINAAAGLLDRHKVNVDNIESDPALTSLFAVEPGDRLAVRAMYDPQRLSCIQFRNNLELTALVKLKPGYRDEHHNVSNPPEGRYHRAYQSTLERLRGQTGADGTATVCAVTPHLHRDWHLPGYLPDIFEATAQSWRERSLQAFTQALALDLLKQNPHGSDEGPFCYDEAAWPGAVASRRKAILKARNDFELSAELDLDPQLVEWIQSIYAAAVHAALGEADPLGSRLYEKLGSAELPFRIAGIAVDHRGDDARTLTRHVMSRVIDLLSAFVDLAMRGSGNAIRRNKVRLTLMQAITDAEQRSKEAVPARPTGDRTAGPRGRAGTRGKTPALVADEERRKAEQEREDRRRSILTDMKDTVVNWQPESSGSS